MRDNLWAQRFGMLKGPKRSEANLQKNICKYLKMQYPRIRFKSGMEGERLAGGANQGGRLRAIQYGPGHPDLVIYHQRDIHCGLALELKKETPFKKDGSLKAGQHLVEQNEWLLYLKQNGWRAEFCWSFDDAKLIIDSFLKR